MPTSLPAASFPAAMLAVGCMTGLLASRYGPEDVIRLAPAPVAAMADATVGNLPTVEEQAADGGIADADRTDAGSHVVRAPDGLFYVRARVNGHRIRFLIDTGASVTLLRAADAKALGLSPAASRFGARVQTASGTAPMAWTQLASVQLAGHDVHGVRAAVVRQGLGVSLLGQNMLSKLGPITIAGDRMELR